MTNVLYGLTAADVVANSSTGAVLPNKSAVVYTAFVGGSVFGQTLFVNPDLSAGVETGGQVTADAQGRVAFYVSDYTGTLWLDWGDGARWAINPTTQDVGIAQAVALFGEPLQNRLDQAETSVADFTTRLAGVEVDSTHAVETAQAAFEAADRPDLVSSLPSVLYVAHRGGSNIAPENTMEAWRAIHSADKTIALEADVYATRDGSLLCMHDSTVNRTTTGSGSTERQTSLSVQNLRVDAGSWFGGNWASDLRVPTFEQFVAEFGGKSLLVVEAKNTRAADRIVDVVVRNNLQRSVIVQSFDQARLVPAVNAGIPVMALASDGATLNPVALAGAGIEWVGVGTCTKAFIDNCHANGIRVTRYTVNRHVDRDTYLNLGIDGFFSDDPLYLKGTHRLTFDPFLANTYYHGHQDWEPVGTTNVALPRGTFSGGYLTLDGHDEPGIFTSVLQGWGCPVKDNQSGGSYQINFKLRFNAFSTTTRWASVFFGATDDRSFNDGYATNLPSNGYHALFRANGQMDLFRIDNSASTLIGGLMLSAGAWTVGTARDVFIKLTPTHVQMSHDVASGARNLVVADSTYRGNYFHFAANTASVSFADVVIT